MRIRNALRGWGLPAFVGVAAACLLTIADASAQEFPNRPIRVIANQSAGGISDVFIRAVGEELHKKWGQPVVVENRPGGRENIGVRACQDSPPDGYTICILHLDAMVFNPYLFKSLPFDPDRVVPVTNLFYILQTLAVDSRLNVKTFDELLALSKAKPGTLSYMTPSYAPALFMSRMQEQKGADWVRVPFKGGADAVTALLSGSTPIIALGEGNLTNLIREGKITPLVMVNNMRSTNFPNVPTLKEIGYDGPMSKGGFGLFVPKGVPDSIIRRYAKVMNEIVNEPAFLQRNVTARSLMSAVNSPEAYAEELRVEREAAAQIVKEAGYPMQ